VLIGGKPVGRMDQGRDGRLAFTYEQEWQDREDSFPLSLSMPLGQRDHSDAVVRPFMEGLLPDNLGILQRWARRFQVSPNNPFSLLAHIGEDCAGAVQFIRPDRYDESLGSAASGVRWLTGEEVAERLRDLVHGRGTGRMAGDHGQFSLAGAQPKMPLLFDGRRWGIPFGRTPTTHILKPPALADLEGLAMNEHLCLRFAAELGLTTARSMVSTFSGEQALVVERYDRLHLDDGTWVRLHQEDIGQALAASPLRKYENEGGPGVPEIVRLLLRECDDPEADVGAFLETLALNWIIGGTDAHAKNYSLLIAPGSVRLAPLYDLISVLPYPSQVHYRKAKLAMRIDREYHLWKIRRRHWEGLAARCELDPEPVVERIRELVAASPAALERAAASVRDEGLNPEMVDRVAGEIHRHIEHCLRALDGTG